MSISRRSLMLKFFIIFLLVCKYSVFGLDFGLTNMTTSEELKIQRSDFPRDFVFGVATAAAQIEGAANEDGKGPSIWDHFVKKFADKIIDHSSNSHSIDHYKRYKEDVKLIKDLGVDCYRFSISWSRILPNGSLSGGINQLGVDHYNNLIDELLKNGIKPFVTLLHHDWPQTLQEKYRGPLSRNFVNDFKDYSEVCFQKFGDRVKNWITINEPYILAVIGHDIGVAAPGRCSKPFGNCIEGNSSTEPYIVSHHLLLAHAAAVGVYREKFQARQNGEIGISLVGEYTEPYSKSSQDKAAAIRAMDFSLGWYMKPLVFGVYPQSMKELVKERLPRFSKKEKELVKGSFDFIGINYYTSRYAKSIPPNPNEPIHYITDSLAYVSVERNGVPIGPKAEGSNIVYIYPQGLQRLLNFIKRKYNDPKIYISENGITESRVDERKLEDAVRDPHRINNILRHLFYIREAIRDGVNVKGYIYWTLFDDFEWVDGYTTRFGFYYTDYKNNLTRIPKESAKWYRDFLQRKS